MISLLQVLLSNTTTTVCLSMSGLAVLWMVSSTVSKSAQFPDSEDCSGEGDFYGIECDKPSFAYQLNFFLLKYKKSSALLGGNQHPNSYPISSQVNFPNFRIPNPSNPSHLEIVFILPVVLAVFSVFFIFVCRLSFFRIFQVCGWIGKIVNANA